MKPMNNSLDRRRFLRATLLGLAGAAASRLPAGEARSPKLGEYPPEIIDTHTHFYDPSRPQGVPWPAKNERVLYRTVLPRNYRALLNAEPVTRTVVVEASPWLEDNQWILDLAAKEPLLIVGFVGSLFPGTKDFQAHVKRFAGNPVFRGIRIRPSPPRRQWEEKPFMDDLKALAERNLTLDLVGGLETLELAAKLAQAIPTLRIVVDHLAGVRIDGKEPAAGWQEAIRAAAKHETVFMKVSGLVEGSGAQDGKAPRELEFYRPTLDAVWKAFGGDRLIYGSNWPVCELFSDLSTVQRLALGYFRTKGAAALEKVFYRNSVRAYQWVFPGRRGN
jgi:L-fuconolactonase